MRSSMEGIFCRVCFHWAARYAAVAVVLACASSQLSAQSLVPGTGHKLTQIGDDFEDEKWSYTFNLPKSSEEEDGRRRLPGGAATNGRWFEGAKRGQPDIIKRVATPEGGPEGSLGSLLLRSNQTGIPGRYSGKFKQDDFICNVSARLRSAIPIAREPSVVVRVYVPPFEQWERRYGPSFGIRTACVTHTTEKTKGKRGRYSGFGNAGYRTKAEPYWPGFFIHFVPGNGANKPDSAYMTIRAGSRGQDLRGPKIAEPGWWTFGMSFLPNGRVEYYAHPGVEDLTAEDHITTQNPYSFRCERVNSLFFNVVSGDNGNWSTPWIVDDAEIFIAR